MGHENKKFIILIRILFLSKIIKLIKKQEITINR
jgi:hypothetical protein